MATSFENNLEELLSCAICLCTLSEPKLLPCSHRFCKPCIVMEMDRSASPNGSQICFPCPLCKRAIKLGKGKNGEEWIVKFKTDRLLKDIQDLLKQEKEDSKDICLPHRKKLSLVCYSCRITGCYICAWQDHRRCSVVKNFQAEARRTKLDFQKPLEEIEKCIDKIVPYVARWSSVRKSLKNQRDYSNRFIEERLKHLKRESVSAVEDLVQDYEWYITRTNMHKYIEMEIRRLMELFPEKINGEIKLFDIQSRLQSKNETVLFPQIQEASKRLESVQDVQILISTVENIKQVLALSTEDVVLKGKDLLTKNANVMSNRFRDNLVQSIDATSPRVVQDSLVTRRDQIDLGNELGKRLLSDLKAALRNAQNPEELVVTTGRLCYSDRYHPQREIHPVDAPNLITRHRKTTKTASVHHSERPHDKRETSPGPVVAIKLTKKRKPNSDKCRREFVLYPRDDSKLKKRRYFVSSHIFDKRQITCTWYDNEKFTKGRNDNALELEMFSFNSLQNKANGEPFPTTIQTVTGAVPAFHTSAGSPVHIFDSTDDEEEGRESARVTWDKSECGELLKTSWTMSYEREGLFTKYSNKFQKKGLAVNLVLVAIFSYA